MGLTNLKDKQDPFAAYTSEHYKNKFRKEELKERELYLEQQRNRTKSSEINSNSNTNTRKKTTMTIQEASDYINYLNSQPRNNPLKINKSY